MLRWESLDPDTFEQMVSVALSRLHQSATRIDGAGGDGGRDVQLHASDTLTLFELKSFTGRLDDRRRSQVKRSLERAAELDPDAWILVVPIDPTPGELAWFEGLKAQFPFPLEWWGRTWLNGTFAAMPDIGRYCCSTGAEEVIDLLRELQTEQAAITSAQDAVERATRLQQRLDEIDPHYHYSLTVGSAVQGPVPPGAVLVARFGDARVDVFERYPGATNDRPITGSISLLLDEAGEELRAQIDNAFAFGGAVTIPSAVLQSFEIDAPAGMGASFTDGTVSLGGSEATIDPPLELLAECIEEDVPVSSLKFRLTRRRAGQHGVVLLGRDSTDCLAATLRVDTRSRRVNFTFTRDLPESSVMPSSLRAAGRWLTSLRPPRKLRLSVPDVPQVIAEEALSEPFVPEDEFVIVEALDDIQRYTGTYFPMPLELTDSEVSEILQAARLINGERVTVSWSSMRLALTPSQESVPAELLSREGAHYHIEEDYSLTIDGQLMRLGTVVTQFAGRVTEPEDVRDAYTAGDPWELVIRPAWTDQAWRWLKRDDDGTK